MIKIICVGKIKERYWKDAIFEYLKRLSKYTKVEIVEIDDENSSNIITNLTKEKNKILTNINAKDYVITLEIEGETLDSILLSKKIENVMSSGYSNITFIIGGSHGLHEEIKEKADFNLSFSKLTFPHQMFRVMLLEQVYRAFRIINNESYHK
ncbi:MAG TPA: 23S rRNA (pseudouridine(1915)-N(3))-methyltransferase RlmH [Mollicutes bacterium]|jgi:23S rRNA (pseudouridine1915-N3)-methyltransferase|nr:23S rRNA (pseudouridine(1915)-N(3))-methyltransferase RlmH [Mollicutes bacterium]